MDGLAPNLQAAQNQYLQLALSAGGLGTWSWDKRAGTVTWDATMEALNGLPPGAGPSTYAEWTALRSERSDAVVELMAQSAATGEAYVSEQQVVWPDGSLHWLHSWGRVLVEDGEIIGAIGCTADFTERKAAELAATRYATRLAELAAHEQVQHEQIAYLSKLSDAALAFTDPREYMDAVVKSAVPRLGDWASLRYEPEPGRTAEVAFAHVDPDRVAWVEGLRKRYGETSDAVGSQRVMRTGVTEFVPTVDAAYLDKALGGASISRADADQIVAELALKSLITVPLRTKRGVVGALQLVMAESGRAYSQGDLSLAELTADRVATALDTMWLTARQRHIAETLQAALLPPSLPSIPGTSIATRYWPAGIGTEVGGDFFDLFEIGAGRWAVVIGDVCGTGPDAAAVVGIARHTIRAAARHGLDHTEVLSWLNDAVIGGLRNRFCTAIYATLAAAGEGAEHGFELTVISGGHPFPIVARAGGTVSSVGAPGTLLGVFDRTEATPVTTRLFPGDAVVLYTDGITDRPPPHDLDVATLEGLVARAAGCTASADGLADALRVELERVAVDGGPAERDDDVALLIIRV